MADMKKDEEALCKVARRLRYYIHEKLADDEQGANCPSARQLRYYKRALQQEGMSETGLDLYNEKQPSNYILREAIELNNRENKLEGTQQDNERP
ncbi:unnamed protein product [Clonostachys rosea f. rosea IK726]|uniref:Uncharacterized protein n=1 Tax=Clonostachys rosea f. rosea IK726 TaxID=1349383 RepID=A0ACA9TEK0_BIOOC|nr:unnamed protein product [Clonostachys rosea f. rosea IK726]